MEHQAITNKYQQTENFVETFPELMIKILEKAKKHLIQAKRCVETNEYIERGNHIIAVVNILEVLCRTITVKDHIEGSKETFDTYEKLMFLVENLIATKAEASEYDYFVNYFEKIKKIWVDLYNEENNITKDLEDTNQATSATDQEYQSQESDFGKRFEFIV